MGIESILSEESLIKHHNEQNIKKVRYSVYEVSYPCIKGASLKEILGMRIEKSERSKILSLKADIMAHDIYFSSFGESYELSESVNRQYGSLPTFLYELSRLSMDCLYGFLYIYVKGGNIRYECACEPLSVLLCRDVRLAVDLAEHAYFLDYGFNKTDYVNAAISNLKLRMLD